MIRAGLLASLALFGCDRPPATTAGSEPAPAPVATPAEGVNDVRGPTPPIPSAAMVEQMLAQRVLDHPRVRPYLHTEVAANVPLRVAAAPELAQGVARLEVAGQVVQVVAAAEARVVFTGNERIGPAKQRVRFEIPPEGVVGHVDLELADNVWQAVDASVVER